MRKLMDAFGPDEEPSERKPFLDGGWAALAVVLWHVFGQVYPYNEAVSQILPRLLLFDGMTAVCLFFVISGFSLSISFCQTGNRERLAQLAAGRYLRLTIPILATCTLVWLAMKTGVIPPADLRPRFSADQAFIIPLWTMHYEPLGSALILTTLALFGKQPYRLWIYGTLFCAVAMYSTLYSLFFAGMIPADVYVRGFHVPSDSSRAVDRVCGWDVPVAFC
jgi:peptidoglycan/LPS O-acetylase OafA/YrhL